ncbi:MAG: nucleotide pyrophosphohydrolase [Elusimicrobiaceae bacterium]|nr:nucleotide pyrophosphohydrolase [Elusimicrobiaceae bacterium]
MKSTLVLFKEINHTLKVLRSSKGCKWDRAQTHESLIKNLKEESQEVINAIKNRDDENLCEELGDLLLQVLFHAHIAQEQKRFTLAQVINGLNKKLIRRHPHVFGNKKVSTPEEALAMWKAVKAKEKALKARKKSKQK